MIRIRITKSVLLGTSSLLAISTGVGACDAPSDELTDTAGSELTARNAGTGVFTLTWAYGTTSGYTFTSNNSTDEYVRTGEKMTFTVPGYFLWQRLYPNDAVPTDLARLHKLRATIKAAFFKGGAELAHKTVSTSTWNGTQVYDQMTSTGAFTVGPGTDTVRFELAITDAAAPGKTATMGYGDFLDVPVIGGNVPNKTALFDTDYGALRQRVLEGGLAVKGADLAIGYSDWRAAQLTDSSTLDRTIGIGTSFGRFGSFEMPLNGDLQYEIAYGAAFDAVRQGEVALAANASSRLFPVGRTGYEGSLAIPTGVAHVAMYFHIKALLIVDYTKFASVTSKRYNQGDRILLREGWDNLGGKAFQDYDFATEAK